ncbi:hypothetical protein PRZ48_010454 [Zasmidium cellare]|uniref:Uncharacterized protein n=1 Tax=Zasmidium cellare TaxID=395010 RepID=A0ABR0E993_ZASCE|nr:hypothetical protein PRZ48_010454 [Zasmidium cellare]
MEAVKSAVPQIYCWVTKPTTTEKGIDTRIGLIGFLSYVQDVQDVQGFPNIQIDSTAFSLQDLGLLHHFTVQTAQTLPAFDCEQYRIIWQHEVPRLAQSHGFLMHAVIGFAAAHQATLSHEQSSKDAARHHYVEALKAFRNQVEAITTDKADALLCFSILVCFLTLYFESEKPSEARDPITEFISLMHTIHSSIGLLSQIRDTLQTSTIGYLLQHTWNRQPHAIPPEVNDSISLLEGLALQHADHPSPVLDASGTGEAISKLRRFYTLSSPRPVDWVHILSWPISLDPEFSLLLEARNPVALCTLAHWCVPACNAPTKWWVGDFFNNLLSAIALHLAGTEFDDAMAWPVSESLNLANIDPNL